jgi:hypothetical protein
VTEPAFPALARALDSLNTHRHPENGGDCCYCGGRPYPNHEDSCWVKQARKDLDHARELLAASTLRGNLKATLNRIGALDEKWAKRAAKFKKCGAPHAAAVLQDCRNDLLDALNKGSLGSRDKSGGQLKGQTREAYGNEQT